MAASAPLPIVTAKWVLVTLGGAALILACVVLGFPLSGILFTVGCFAAAVVLTAFYEWRQARRFVRLLSMRLEAPQSLLSGRSATLTLTASLDQPVPGAAVHARIEPHAGTSAPLEIAHGVISHGHPAMLTFQVTPLGRGTLTWNTVYLRVKRSKWLLAWQSTVELPVPCRTVAVPNFLCAEDVPRIAAMQNLGGDRRSRGMLSEGREFDSLRPYAVGDDLRVVDWKRSARTTSLLVKVFRPETHQRVEILLDCSRRTSTRIGERLQLDYTIDAVSYLLRVAESNRDEVGLFAFNHTVVKRLPGSRSRKQEQLITDALIGIEPGTLEADFELVTRYGRSLRRRSLIILLTSVSNSTALETLHRSLIPLRSRHLVLVVSIADRSLKELTLQAATSVTDAYRVAAAQEQLEEIERRIGWFRASGMECAYTELSHLPIVLAEKYREVKRLGKL